MGRKLEQLTRGDSKEHIHFPLGSTRSKKKSKFIRDSTEKDILNDIDTISQDARQPRKAKVDRVESIRNLFRRSRSWDSAKDLDDIPVKDDITSTSCDLLNTSVSNEEADVVEQENEYESINTEKDASGHVSLYRSASTSVLPVTSISFTNSDIRDSTADLIEKLSDTCGEDIDKSGKKGNFPYAFLRSRLTSVAEERTVVARDECGDSGRGTGSQCGSISDIRTSYSENSDTKSSFSESSDNKSSCSESSHREEDEKPEKEATSSISGSRSTVSPIPAPNGFGDSDYVITVKVDGNVTPTSTSVYVNNSCQNDSEGKEKASKITYNGVSNCRRPSLTDEEKLQQLDTNPCSHCPHCGQIKLMNSSDSTHSLLPIKRRPKSQIKQRPRTIGSNIPSTQSVYEAIFPLESKRSSLNVDTLDTRLHGCSGLGATQNNFSLDVAQGDTCQTSRGSSLDRSGSWRQINSSGTCGSSGGGGGGMGDGMLCSLSTTNRYRRRAPSLPRVPLLPQVRNIYNIILLI